MKKADLYTGFAFLLAGLGFLALAFWGQGPLDSLFCGFAGAGIGPGLVQLGKYFYWTRPQNRARYQERLEAQRIELHDELKTKLRDRAGRYAYLAGLLLLSGAIVLSAVLNALEAALSWRMLLLALGSCLLLQLLLGQLFYWRLLKKFQ